MSTTSTERTVKAPLDELANGLGTTSLKLSSTEWLRNVSREDVAIEQSLRAIVDDVASMTALLVKSAREAQSNHPLEDGHSNPLACTAQLTAEIAAIIEVIVSVSRNINVRSLRAVPITSSLSASSSGALVSHAQAVNDLRSEILASMVLVRFQLMSIARSISPQLPGTPASALQLASAVEALNSLEAALRQLLNTVVAIAPNNRDAPECHDQSQAPNIAKVRFVPSPKVAVQQTSDPISQRWRAVMHESGTAERRAYARLPVYLEATLHFAGKIIHAHAVDVSVGGACLRAAGLRSLQPNADVQVELEKLGTFHARIVASSGERAHLQFENQTPAAIRTLAEYVEKLGHSHALLGELAKRKATLIGSAFANAVNAGKTTEADMFDTAYQALGNPMKPQFMVQYLDLAEKIVPPLLASLLTRENDLIFTCIVDRNGYVPVQSRNYAHLLPSGASIWDTAYCGSRCFMNDDVGLAAARNTGPYMIQVYPFKADTEQVVTYLIEANAPIFVRGRHWGALRAAFSASRSIRL